MASFLQSEFSDLSQLNVQAQALVSFVIDNNFNECLNRLRFSLTSFLEG